MQEQKPEHAAAEPEGMAEDVSPLAGEGPALTGGGPAPAGEASAGYSGGTASAGFGDVGLGAPPERVRQPVSAERQEEIHRLAVLAAGVAADLKAENIRILDMRSLVSYTDFLVICTGRSTRQTRRISEEIGLRLKRELKLLPLGVQGDRTGDWILMDYLDFIVHTFTPETRDFYRLDVMWKQAPAETLDADGQVVPEARGLEQEAAD